MYHFISNLKPYTLFRGRGNRRFDGYLLSVQYLKVQAKLLPTAHRDENALVADNGNVHRIVQMIRHFAPEVDSLHQQRELEEAQLPYNYARPGDLSNELKAGYRDLATKIRDASHPSVTPDALRLIVEQFAQIDPIWSVGMEDFTIPTLTSLSIEPEYLDLPLDWYATCTERAISYYHEMQNGVYGHINGKVFAGLHAIDHDTAYQAGVLAGQANVTGIASGLVGAMKDNNYVDFRIRHGDIIPYPKATPRSYPRVADITAGFYRGYASVTDRRLKFHALGPGSPILLPILSLLCDKDTWGSTDSTAPIKDACKSRTICLYVDDPAPLKYKAHRIAEYWLGGERGWDCQCPYCRRFNHNHPQNLTAARAWWISQGSPRLGASDMRHPNPLADHLPLLGSASDRTIRREAALARIGHNHWVVQRLERQIQKRMENPDALRDWVASVVQSYVDSVRSSSWGRAAATAHTIMDAATAELSQISSGGELIDPQ